MIPNKSTNKVKTTNDVVSSFFSISDKNSSHIMKILRDTLYSDKIMAVLREYSANAWDANRAAGKGDVPIKVTLPTILSPVLKIRDYGDGLSPEDMINIFTKYGESTKRDSNDFVGMLGIGSKSAFAYSNTFNVVSMHEGKKRTYVASLDETDCGILSLIDEVDCDERGTEIQVAVLASDIDDFHSRAEELFRFFEPAPILNIDLKDKREVIQLDDNIKFLLEKNYYFSNKSYVIVGCIPYKIEHKDVQINKEFSNIFERVQFIIRAGIGDVDISASRETIKFSDKSLNFLKESFERCAYLLINYIEKYIDAGASNYEKYCRSYEYSYAISDAQRRKLHSSFVIKAAGIKQKFFIVSMYEKNNVIYIKSDRDKRPKGLLVDANGSHPRILLSPNKEYNFDTAAASIESELKAIKIDGIQILPSDKLSMLSPVVKKTKVSSNPKTRKNIFIYNGIVDDAKKSLSWDITDLIPDENSVYVILDAFHTNSISELRDYYTNRNTLKSIGFNTPDIFGYKKDKVKTYIGIEFNNFCDNLKKNVIASNLFSEMKNYYELAYRYNNCSESTAKFIVKILGDDHHISKVFSLVFNKDFKKKSLEYKMLFNFLKIKVDKNLLSKYPLLEYENCFIDVINNYYGSSNVKDKLMCALDYIKMIDEKEGKNK